MAGERRGGTREGAAGGGGSGGQTPAAPRRAGGRREDRAGPRGAARGGRGGRRTKVPTRETAMSLDQLMASPKSQSLTTQSPVMRTFSGLMSLCMTVRLWR